MFNINTSSKSSITVNPRFTRRPYKMAVIRNQGEANEELLDAMGSLTSKQPGDCNNCKIKAQRKPRWMRKMGSNYLEYQTVLTTHHMFYERGMKEEAMDVLEFDGINLRDIQIYRRRKRDQAQRWKRSGKLIESTHGN